MDLTPGPEAYEAAEENCRQWVRMVTGNPQMDISPLNRERARALVDLVWPLAYRAGREDAAKANTALLDALRRLRDFWYRQPGWTEAADTVDVLIDAFAEPTNLGRSEASASEHTQDGGE